MSTTTQALITAVRRYLGDRDPGQAGGDLRDVWAAIEAAEAEPAARIVGDTRFEGWLSCHEPDRNQNRTLRYSKQDMRDAYWAGYSEASAATPVAQEPCRFPGCQFAGCPDSGCYESTTATHAPAGPSSTACDDQFRSADGKPSDWVVEPTVEQQPTIPIRDVIGMCELYGSARDVAHVLRRRLKSTTG